MSDNPDNIITMEEIEKLNELYDELCQAFDINTNDLQEFFQSTHPQIRSHVRSLPPALFRIT